MIQEGQITLFKFPQTDQTLGKLRPALVLRKIPGPYDDWLICMVSSQLSQELPEFDVVVYANDPDFEQSGLKTSSVIRVFRLAVVNKDTLLGSIGNISGERLNLIKSRLSSWIKGT
ncbi:MAG: type II toxin-antitoxin system PemK/MazF family toxin [Deltaproteobacteria bacterium]|nr:type II toxin-antitoxin system PemK/MazF family toxin [Deltaproteobacteria bacterium]